MRIPFFGIKAFIFHLMFCLIRPNTESNNGVYFISEKNVVSSPTAMDIMVSSRDVLDMKSKICNVLSEKPILIGFNLGCSYSSFVTSMLNSFGLDFYPDEIQNCVVGGFVAYHKGLPVAGWPIHVSYITAIIDLVVRWEWKELTWILDKFLGITAGMVEDALDANHIRGNVIKVDVQNIKANYYNNLLRRPNLSGFVATCSEDVLKVLLPQISSTKMNSTGQLPPWIVVFLDMPTTSYWKSTLKTQVTYLVPKKKTVLSSLSFTANFSEFTYWDRVQNICDGSRTISSFTSRNLRINGSTSQSERHYRELILLEYFDVVFNELTKDVQAIKFAHWSQESQLNILEKFSDADKDLKLRKKKISAVTLKDHPYSDIGNDSETGFVVAMFKEILKSLRGELQLHLNDDLQFGELVQGSWSGVVGALQKKNADLALAKLGMTKDRISSISFSAPFHRGKIVALIRRPSERVSTSYFQRFQLYVWIVLHLLLFFTAFALSISQVYNSHNGQCDGRMFQNLFIVDFLTGSVLVDVFFGEIKGISSRILFVTLGVTAYLVGSHYGCDFTSIRTAQNEMMPFKNLDELAENRHYTVTYIRSLSIYEIVNNAPRGAALAKIRIQLIKNDFKDLVSNLSEGLDKVYSGPYALLVDRKVAEDAVRDNCSFSISPSVYINCFYHIGARLDFPYTKLISVTLVRMMEHGIVNMFARRHLVVIPSSCGSTGVEKVAFGLPNIMEPLLLLAIGFVYLMQYG